MTHVLNRRNERGFVEVVAFIVAAVGLIYLLLCWASYEEAKETQYLQDHHCKRLPEQNRSRLSCQTTVVSHGKTMSPVTTCHNAHETLWRCDGGEERWEDSERAPNITEPDGSIRK